ncbi:TetR-like C-terminal domain-containing protein [Curtobacterium flaccumfaciens]|uniref:WHG domain-containing protein n=1 Tax=Curtobacterium flaccumfaciens TaxID=2035 RepID=UPI001414D956
MTSADSSGTRRVKLPERPEQYRLLFGGAWDAANIDDSELIEREERRNIGQDALLVLADAIAAASVAGSSSSTDPRSDAAALWVGLHGLATLRRATPLFPWPTSIEHDLIYALARLQK